MKEANYILMDNGYTRPIAGRTFTTQEVSRMLNISVSGVLAACHRLGIEYEVAKYDNGRKAVVQYEGYKKLKNYYDNRKLVLQKQQQNKIVKTNAVATTLEEMKKTASIS